MYLKTIQITEGMHPSERLVSFLNANSETCYAFIFHKFISSNLVEVILMSVQPDENGNVLIQLPGAAETTYGAHRVFVKPEQLLVELCSTCKDRGTMLYSYSRGDGPPGFSEVGCPDCDKGKRHSAMLKKQVEDCIVQQKSNIKNYSL